MCWPGFQSTNRCFTVLLLLPFSTWTLTCFPVKKQPLHRHFYSYSAHRPCKQLRVSQTSFVQKQTPPAITLATARTKAVNLFTSPSLPRCEIICRHVHTHTYAFMHANSFSLCNRLNNDLLPSGYLSFANVRQCFLSGNELMNDGWMKQHIKCRTIFFPFFLVHCYQIYTAFMQSNRWGLLEEWLMLQTCTGWNKDQDRREFPETDDRAWHGSWRSTVKSIRDEDRIKWRQFCLENRKSTAYDRISSEMKRKVLQIAPDVGAFRFNKKSGHTIWIFSPFTISVFSCRTILVCQKLPIWCFFFFFDIYGKEFLRSALVWCCWSWELTAHG